MRRRKLVFNLAVVLSLAAHVAVGWRVMGMSLELDTQRSLFGRQVEERAEPIRVTRAVRDLIVDDTAEPTDLDTPAPDATKVRDDSDKLIEEVDPTKLLPADPDPVDPAELAAPKEVDATPPPPKSDDPRADPAKPLNLTPKLLAMAQPSLALPEYTGPTDTVETFTGESVDRGATIDMTKIDLTSIGGSPDGVPGGTGLAGGLPGGRGLGEKR